MIDLLQTEFFGLVTENSQEVKNEDIQSAYGKFIVHIDTISQVGNDLIGIIRKLNITRIELLFLSTEIQYEQGGKCA